MCNISTTTTQFRGPCLNVVRNVNSPPNSTPCWTSASMCNISTAADQPHAPKKNLSTAYQPHAVTTILSLMKNPVHSFVPRTEKLFLCFQKSIVAQVSLNFGASTTGICIVLHVDRFWTHITDANCPIQPQTHLTKTCTQVAIYW